MPVLEAPREFKSNKGIFSFCWFCHLKDLLIWLKYILNYMKFSRDFMILWIASSSLHCVLECFQKNIFRFYVNPAHTLGNLQSCICAVSLFVQINASIGIISSISTWWILAGPSSMQPHYSCACLLFFFFQDICLNVQRMQLPCNKLSIYRHICDTFVKLIQSAYELWRSANSNKVLSYVDLADI